MSSNPDGLVRRTTATSRGRYCPLPSGHLRPLRDVPRCWTGPKGSQRRLSAARQRGQREQRALLVPVAQAARGRRVPLAPLAAMLQARRDDAGNALDLPRLGCSPGAGQPPVPAFFAFPELSVWKKSSSSGEIDLFLKPKIPPCLGLLEIKAVRTLKRFFFVYFPTYMSVPHFYFYTQSREFLLAYL